MYQENGMKGDHPHLNIIWLGENELRTDHFTAKLKRHMKDLPDIEQPNVIRTKRITDINYLIGAYLTKESGYTVLIDSGLYDIDSLKQKVGQKYNIKTKWNSILSYSESPLAIIEYCEENDIDYLKDCCIKSTLCSIQYSKDATGCKRILASMSRKYRMQVMHLFRKADDIHYQILSLIEESEKIEF